MTATDPRIVSMQRRAAAHISWAMTPHRAERTAPARRKSPMSLDYWIAKVRAERRITDEQTIRKTAESLHRAYMTRLSLKAAAKRATRRTT